MEDRVAEKVIFFLCEQVTFEKMAFYSLNFPCIYMQNNISRTI